MSLRDCRKCGATVCPPWRAWCTACERADERPAKVLAALAIVAALAVMIGGSVAYGRWVYGD